MAKRYNRRRLISHRAVIGQWTLCFVYPPQELLEGPRSHRRAHSITHLDH